MDEPLSALDKQLRETMQIELRRLHRQLGATIVNVTHDQREALTMSDRVAVLKDGRLVQIDTPERLYDRPCDAFVASFIGEATMLDVTRAGNDAVRLGDTVLRTAHPLPSGDKLLLAVQTEKLVIDGENRHANANRLSCRVTEVLYQGESLRVFAALADGTAISLRQPGGHDARRRIPAPGASMTVALDPQDTIVVSA
jgi:putative spermidine/putrescine transport system ATP-binding protein